MKKINESLKKWIKKGFDLLPLSDEQFVKVMYFYKFQRLLNIRSPQTFTEKLHWLNLSGYLEKYTTLADKYAVREYVASKIGGEYLNELYGVYTNAEEIDFDALPEKFVLKATHGSTWNILCKDKNKLDLEETKRQLMKWLGTNYYRRYRETVYKNIPPRIICEHYLEDENQNDIKDYKYFCFNGRVKIVKIEIDRFTNFTRYYYDRNWVIWPFKNDPNKSPAIMEKPKNFERMKEIAETLAEGIPFVRIDLFNIGSTILFGEMTFSPSAGYGKIRPEGWDYELGKYLDLPAN